jgi:hypothetical protein
MSISSGAQAKLVNRRIFLRILEKRRPAALAAEVVRNARVVLDVQGMGDAHGYAADGVDEF